MNSINSITVPKDVTDIIKTYIADFEGSELRQKMAYGEDYYRSRNTTIMARKMLIYAEDADGNPYELEDPYKANNKLPSGYFKILVDQKVSYLLANPLTVESPQADELTEILGRRWPTLLMQTARDASKKAVGWMHPYLDAEGLFKVAVTPPEQVIPVYKAYDHETLELVIRYYTVKALNQHNESVMVTRVEVWDDQEVTYYQENTETGLYDLLDEDAMLQAFGRSYPNPKYHFQKDLKHGDRITKTEGLAWGMVPFIPLYNNDEEEYDLQPVRPYIDAYDIVSSDFMNNLQDFQDIYWILKGYDGSNLAEFLYQVKRYKTLKVSDEGDAKAEQIEIPYLARKEALAGLESDIFTFGMGVNPNISGDGNVTNVVIRSRYAALDLKAGQFELEVTDFIYKLIEFVNRYQEIKGGPAVEIAEVVFNRSLVMNEVELLEANTKQKGTISEDTRLSNHPWVSDVEAEKELIEQDNAGAVNLDEPLEGGGDGTGD